MLPILNLMTNLPLQPHLLLSLSPILSWDSELGSEPYSYFYFYSVSVSDPVSDLVSNPVSDPDPYSYSYLFLFCFW